MIGTGLHGIHMNHIQFFYGGLRCVIYARFGDANNQLSGGGGSWWVEVDPDAF